MTVYALLTEKQTFFDANSNELSGGKLFVYLAGTTTKATSYAETDGVSPNSNPIVLNSRGEVPNGLYVQGGATYKLVLAPSTDTDPPTSPIWTRDNLAAYNDISVTSSVSEWITSTFVVSFSNGTTFTVPGDVTDTYQTNRRVRATIGSGNIYGRIDSSTFALGVTTVVVTWDSGALDATLTAVDYALLAGANQSVPVPVNQIIRTSLVVGSSGNQSTVTGGLVTQTSTSGGDVYVLTSSAAGAEVAARVTVTDATSGAGLKLGNSALNKQASVRARSDGGLTFYTNQTSGGGTTSGTQGADLDAAGAFNAVRVSEGTSRVFSRNAASSGQGCFTSSGVAYTGASVVHTFAHGLAGVPVLFQSFAVCTTNDLGYVVGDVVDINGASTASVNVTTSANATNVYVAITGQIVVTDRGTPATYTSLTVGRWNIFVRAWY